MFEAKLNQAGILKYVLDAIKELVTDVNFDCDEDGMKLQAMDNSHVALVALQLRASGFGQYRCDRQMTLGINVPSFQKITRCAANEDILTLRAYDDGDVLSIVSETLNADRVAEYEMKMMDIDIEHLGIPETKYDAEVALPSSEFNRIIRDLKEMGESIRIEATKEGVKFSASGDIGTGAVMLKHNAEAKKAVKVGEEKEVIDIESDEEPEETQKDEEEQEDEDEDAKKKVKKEKKPVMKQDPDEDKTQVETQVENTQADSDGSQGTKPKKNGKKSKKKKIIEDEEDEEEEEPEEEPEEEGEEEDEDMPKSKKRKLAKKPKKEPKKNGKAKDKSKGKATKDGKEKEKEEDDLSVSISLQQSVSLTFSIKYLSNFTKATPLAKRLTLHMSNEVPLLVAYEFETGYVRYYLAPKIEDD